MTVTKDTLTAELTELKDKFTNGQDQMIKLQKNLEQLTAMLNQLQGAMLVIEKLLSTMNTENSNTHSLVKD